MLGLAAVMRCHISLLGGGAGLSWPYSREGPLQSRHSKAGDEKNETSLSLQELCDPAPSRSPLPLSCVSVLMGERQHAGW